MLQETLIARVRDLCRADRRLSAALTYGSFAQGDADEHSDIEFWLFFDSPPDPRAWLAEIGPAQHTGTSPAQHTETSPAQHTETGPAQHAEVGTAQHAEVGTAQHIVVNEFGAHVVFFFPGLIRGEFHFATAADIPAVATWAARGAPTDRMIVVDRTGALRQALDSLPAHPARPTDPAELCGRFANWFVLAHHVAARGEYLRAVDALAHVQRHLLWMARLAEGRTEHWLTPSRRAERELPPDLIAALASATATADRAALAKALTAAWQCGRAVWIRLAAPTPTVLFAELDRAYPASGNWSGQPTK